MITNFERNYDTTFGVNFAKENGFIPICIVSCYVGLCYYGKKLMKCRKPFDLKTPLAYWNLLLSTFSFIGMTRTAPVLLYNLSSMSIKDNLCLEPKNSFGQGASGLWLQLFVYSKIPELIDTFFIIARKKPLLFLHWYHHITVLLFCWHSYATEAPAGLFFASMNYAVHSVMYGYYYLMAVDSKPKWISPFLITSCQIAQMIVGCYLSIYSYILLSRNNECSVTKENVMAGCIMYGSYLYLFAKFARDKIVLKNKSM